VVLLAIAFALAHFANPNVTMLGIGNIALAGIFLGLAFYAPGGIWTASGVHLGWNSVLAAVAFALGHVANPNVTALAIGNIALAGIFLGLAFYAPGGIWTAWGAHLGWNALLAALDAPVSGVPFRIPFLDYEPGDPAWLTGGAFGPEGGLASTLALTIAVLVARRWAGGKDTT
jgi:membrane protease YdiL (CAAX protease family)